MGMGIGVRMTSVITRIIKTIIKRIASHMIFLLVLFCFSLD